METHHALSIRSMARPFVIAKLKGFSGRILTTARFTIKELSLWISSSRKTALNQSPVPLNFRLFKAERLQGCPCNRNRSGENEKYLSALGLYDYFDEIVCASMVAKGKPEPDIYLYAAENSDLLPKTALHLRTRSTA